MPHLSFRSVSFQELSGHLVELFEDSEAIRTED